MTSSLEDPDSIDDRVDDEIAACLNMEEPRSFFLFAGAGSGKTRSLEKALQHVRAQYGSALKFRGQKVAVITYTNAACDEIKRRVQFDPNILVSTIHSFAWTLIDGLNNDIRAWLRVRLAQDIAELRDLESRGRVGTKASNTRLAQIASKTRRLDNISNIRRFIYNPNGDNRTKDSLNHSEVIEISADFLQIKTVMQSIVIGAYPIILVDESQDTNRHLVDALFAVQSAHEKAFLVGMFGDMMQRIYNDGKDGLGSNLPLSWARPIKKLNHRCPKRIVSLINKIREATDRQGQLPRSDSIDGHARIFVLPADTADKAAAEAAVAKRMTLITGEPEWEDDDGCKRLILEHRMAARRMGFLDMFVALHEIEEFRTGLLDGTLSTTRFFTANILPLVEQRADKFAIARLVREESPLLSAEKLREAKDPLELLRQAQRAVDSLLELWKDAAIPSFEKVLLNIAETGLFVIPDSLRPSAFRDTALTTDEADDVEVNRFSERTDAIDAFLQTPFDQIKPYASYVNGTASFDTHQGVKGLEFPRVMVIMDDSEARGFLFKYEKLFGGGTGEDTTIASTRRLFYVTCSRARRGLALIAYSTDPQRVKQHVLREGWFTEDEIVVGIPHNA